MGHDEDKNFGGGTTPVSPEPVASNTRAVLGNHRIGMRPARDFSTQDELNRISGVTTQTQTAGGDIVLNNGTKKKSKKMLLIVFFTLAVIIVSIVLVLILTGVGKTNVPDNERTAFNKFANYLLYGKDSKEDISAEKYRSNHRYYIDEIYDNSASSDEFTEKLDDYFKNVESRYDKYLSLTDKNKYHDLSDALDTYKEKLDLYHYTIVSPLLSVTNLLGLYFDEDKLESKLDDYFSSYDKSNIASTRSYGSDYNERAKNFISIVKQYHDLGCVSQERGTIATSCLNNNVEPFLTLNNNYVEFVKYSQEKAEEVHGLQRYIFSMVWSIKKVIYEAE